MGSGNCAFWAPATFDLDDDELRRRARPRRRSAGEDPTWPPRAAPPRPSPSRKDVTYRTSLCRARLVTGDAVSWDQRGPPRAPRHRPAVGRGPLPARGAPGRSSRPTRRCRRSGTTWRRWAGSACTSTRTHGGEGYGLAELAVVLEELGRAVRPGPVPADGAGRAPLDPAGGRRRQRADAPARAWRRARPARAVAFAGACSRPRPTATTLACPGPCSPVLGGGPGRRCSWSRRGRRDEVLVRRRPGRGHRHPLPSLDATRRVAEVELDGVAVPPIRQLRRSIRRRVADLAAVLLVGRVRRRRGLVRRHRRRPTPRCASSSAGRSASSRRSSTAAPTCCCAARAGPGGGVGRRAGAATTTSCELAAAVAAALGARGLRHAAPRTASRCSAASASPGSTTPTST